MRDLIEALHILLKYMDKDVYAPCNCEHDILRVYGPQQSQMSSEDISRLSEIGFDWDADFECWYSFRFGSC